MELSSSLSVHIFVSKLGYTSVLLLYFPCRKWPLIHYVSDVELSLQQGVYLYLGYSQKDEALLKKVTKQGALEAIGAIQGLVSYHNVNSNKVNFRFWQVNKNIQFFMPFSEWV